MRRLIVAAIFVSLTITILVGQEENSRVSFTVRCVLEHTSDRIDRESMPIEEGVETDIPLRQTFKMSDGTTASLIGHRSFVPSPSLMSSAEPARDKESIAIGPRLTCRVRRVPNDQLLLDVKLSETNQEKHDPHNGILAATSRQSRTVQPIRLNQPVTLAWPADDRGNVTRHVTITISNAP